MSAHPKCQFILCVALAPESGIPVELESTRPASPHMSLDCNLRRVAPGSIVAGQVSGFAQVVPIGLMSEGQQSGILEALFTYQRQSQRS